MTTIRVPCTVEIEQTPESLHAHAIPESDIGPGDIVVVEGAPTHVAYGEVLTVACTATIIRAGALRRAWTQATGLLAITELYEVGFQPKGAAP